MSWMFYHSHLILPSVYLNEKQRPMERQRLCDFLALCRVDDLLHFHEKLHFIKNIGSLKVTIPWKCKQILKLFLFLLQL